jgi:DNA-binding LacI/PurR family transcriptional regulator
VPDPTVYDVAKQAGVSISTVSRVLNAQVNVRAGTRERVLAAIDELGFVPKAEASALARRATHRIGVLAPFFGHPSFVERMRGVANALSNSPYELVVYTVDSAARRDSYLASLPMSRRLDGLIVMALPFNGPSARRLVASSLEVVLIEFSTEPFASIRIDDRAGGRLAAEYLLERGHRRCAFVGDCDVPDYAIRTSDWRLEGYREALREAGEDLPEDYIALAPHSRENARVSAHRLLDLPAPPTAIFVASDYQAVGVLKAARERGLEVPAELAVIGFDDLDIANYIGLTTIHQPLEESGRVAVELLLARLSNPSRPAQRVRFPLTLVARETA